MLILFYPAVCIIYSTIVLSASFTLLILAFLMIDYRFCYIYIYIYTATVSPNDFTLSGTYLTNLADMATTFGQLCFSTQLASGF